MTTSGRRLNENVLRREDGSIFCAHCDQSLEGGPTDYVSKLPFYEATVDAAGPHIFTDSRAFVDTDVVFRQYICPGCAVAFHTEVVPVGEDFVPS